MKQAEIKVGETYQTKIGEGLVKVRVICETTVSRHYAYKPSVERKAFRVARIDNGKHLPKPRTAAALRPLPGPNPAVVEYEYLGNVIRFARRDGEFDKAVALEELRRGLRLGNGQGRNYQQALSRIIRERIGYGLEGVEVRS